MIIKELLKHIYPSCKVKVYFTIDDRGEVNEYLAGDLFNEVTDDAECDDWGMYENFLAIFLG